MLGSNYTIRPILPSEETSFIKSNIQASFITDNPTDVGFFGRAISLAMHIGIVEIEKEIKGGVMIFKRWHDAIWVTNIFIDPVYQSRGVSMELYKYTLQYCIDNEIAWAFCNPIPRILPLRRRWGILP